MYYEQSTELAASFTLEAEPDTWRRDYDWNTSEGTFMDGGASNLNRIG